jgi:hypothetical protein
MFWLGQADLWLALVLLVAILALSRRNRLYGKFPFFTAYCAYICVAAILRSVFLSHPHVYFYVYWYAEPGAFMLKIAAVHESFMRVFRGFYRVKWFRVLFPGTIMAALAISIWRAYAHPAHASALGSAIIAGSVTAQYIVLAISMLFIALVTLLRASWRVHEFRLMLGFGISALAIFLEGALRSEFGTRFIFLTTMLAGMAYILVLIIWLTAVWHPTAARKSISDTGVSPEALVRELRRQLTIVRSLLRW